MKKIILIILLISNSIARANMASPIIPGTLVASPFTSQYVDILGESIFIKLNQGFTTANYNIEYRISSKITGVQIPLLFYAIGYADNFKVYIDGKEIQVKDLPYDKKDIEGKIYADFKYFFIDTIRYEQDQILIEEAPGSNFQIQLADLKYFETDITEGEHVIKIEYTASSWIDTSDWVNDYTFRYALSPAKYWNSFGTLTITLDATSFNGKINCNLPAPNNGALDSIATWNFNKLPVELIQIQYIPEIKPFAKALIKLNPERIALIIGFLLLVLHVILIIRYRNRNMNKRFSPVMIIGSFLVPLIYIILTITSYDFIDYVIGEEASGRHGYIFLFIFLYPVIMPLYLIVMWLTDRIYKRSNLRKDNIN